MTYKIYTNDVLKQLKELPDNYFDAVLSDPPYGLSFMGKEWDKGVPSKEVYAELLRVLKPGAFGIHFGGTRTFHRLAVNLEDAGFEMRDCLSWLYGSGFPKSHNISKAIDKAAGAERQDLGPHPTIHGKNMDNFYHGNFNEEGPRLSAPATPSATQWDGYGTALKPAWEPALLVQKPVAKTFANNALTYGCGGLNIDGARVGNETIIINGQGNDNMFHGNFSGNVTDPVKEGRFPANLILDEEAAAVLDAQVPFAGAFAPVKSGHSGKSRGIYGDYGTRGDDGATFYNDKGGPSRFFYCAKVSTKERNAGCGEFKDKIKPGAMRTSNGDAEKGVANFDKGFQDIVVKNHHPTLKPITLTTYLAKLLLVPLRTDGQPRRILVPFSGAGSEMIGCLNAGWDEVVGIELNQEYVDIATARIEHHLNKEREK